MPSVNFAFVHMDISTRPNRRKAVAIIVRVLEAISKEEEAYMHRIPSNLQGCEAYEAAEYSTDQLADAISYLYDAY